jgi:putative Holliday junction resolvase
MPILGFDHGTERIGVAIVPDDTSFALPLMTISGTEEEQWQQIDDLIRKQSPRSVVIGLPYTMAGNEGDQAAIVRDFGAKIFERYNIPVNYIDERMSSQQAAAAGATDIDASSAAIILDSFLAKSGASGDVLFDL